jgi:hypothetical protein
MTKQNCWKQANTTLTDELREVLDRGGLGFSGGKNKIKLIKKLVV